MHVLILTQKEPDSAITHQELKGRRRGLFRGKKVDLSRLYTGDDLNQLEMLPAKTARALALERIRAALSEVPRTHARTRTHTDTHARTRAHTRRTHR